MSNTGIEVIGVRDTIRSLNKLEPKLRQRFTKESNAIAMPAIEEARRRYEQAGWGISHARGVSHNWSGPAVRGRKVLPWSLPKARSGVKVKVDASNKRTGVILFTQMDAGTAILETAGRLNNNPLGFAMNSAMGKQIKRGTSRILGPSLFSKKKQIEGKFEENVKVVMRRVQRELN